MSALCLIAALAGPASTPGLEDRHAPKAVDPPPDLGSMRFVFPVAKRELWLGLGLGGVYLPSSISGFSRDVWTARAPLGWAFGLVPRIKLGGRHAMVWYDSTDARTRLSEHDGELAIVVGAGLILAAGLALGLSFLVTQSGWIL